MIKSHSYEEGYFGISDDWPKMNHGAGGGIWPDWDLIGNGFTGV